MSTLSREPAEILVIDDDSQSLAGTTTALNSVGHTVYQARDRLTALRLARAQAIDLIVCDVHIGGDGGMDLSVELRGLPGMQDVPVMFVSRTQLPDIVRRSHEAGAAYYLRKPIDPDVLIDLVGKALWMPHLVNTRLELHQRPKQPMQPPKKTAARSAVLQGIRLPLA